MKNFSSHGSNKSFIDCVQTLSRSLENRNNSPDLRDSFFKLIDKKDQLPENISEEVTNNFIYCLVELAYSDPDQREALKAVNALFRFVKTDLQVFTHFKPSRIVIRKLKLDKYLIGSNSEAMESVLDFAIFLLRYYENVDYEDFSEVVSIIAKIKRAELHRVWIDIEEIIGRLDTMENLNQQNQTNNSSAFGEIFSYMDKIKKELDSCKGVLKNQGAGDMSFNLEQADFLRNRNYSMPKPNPTNEKTNFDKRLNDFESKLERLRDQDSVDPMYMKHEELNAVKSGYKINQQLLPSAMTNDEVKKMNTHLERIEAQLIDLRNGVKVNLKDKDVSDTSQNLTGAMTTLSERIAVIEKLHKSSVLDSMSGKQNELDFKIKVSTLEKKLESLTEKISAFPVASKPPIELEKMKQEHDALEGRLAKEIINVSDAFKKGDFALQNDLKRLVDMVSSMQKDIQDLQNNPPAGSLNPTNEKSLYELEFLKKKISALETRTDKQPTRADYDFLAGQILRFDKGFGLPLTGESQLGRNTASGDTSQTPNLDQLKRNALMNTDFTEMQVKLSELDKKMNTLLSSPQEQSKLLDNNKQNTNPLPDQKAIDPKIIEIEKKIKDINLAVTLKIEQQNNEIQGILKQINGLQQDIHQLPVNNASANDASKIRPEIGFARIEKFVQEFANRLAEIKIKKITLPATTAAQKMDKFEWVVRNIEFISPLLPQNLLIWAQETLLDPREPNPNRDALTIARHNSEAALNIINLIKEASITQNPAIRELLDNYLSFLEILLFSDVNLEKALNVGIVDLLFHILDPPSNYTIEERRGALKGILACSRTSHVTNTIFATKRYLRILIDLLIKPWDQDCLLSLANLFSKAFAENNKFGTVVEESNELIQVLFTCLNTYEKNEVFIEEALQIFMLFTEKKENLTFVRDPSSFQKIINIAKTSTNKETKGLAQQTLVNASQNPIFLQYFNSQGVKFQS